MIWMRSVMASSASSPSQLMALADGLMVVIDLVQPVEATLMQTIKLCARDTFCYELDLAAVRPDPPQLPGLRSFAPDFPSRLFDAIRCHLRPSGDPATSFRVCGRRG